MNQQHITLYLRLIRSETLTVEVSNGIVAGDVEDTLKNLGDLRLEGMADTNRIILDMLLHKQK